MDQWRKDRAKAFLVALEKILNNGPYLALVGPVEIIDGEVSLGIDAVVSITHIDAALDAIDPKTPPQASD